MNITRNRTYLIQPVKAIVVARDLADAKQYAHPSPVVPSGTLLPSWPIHYTDAARTLDTYA